MRHGTKLDTGNRFNHESRERFDDGWESFTEEPDPKIELIDDASRSAFATNNSPDVPFTHSINPYRGCEHACSYCVRDNTPILMADGSERMIRDLTVGNVIYGTVQCGSMRYLAPTRVLAHWSTTKPGYRITLADGRTIDASEDHRFLAESGWKYVSDIEQGPDARPHLVAGDRLVGGEDHDEAAAGLLLEPAVNVRSARFQRAPLCPWLQPGGSENQVGRAKRQFDAGRPENYTDASQLENYTDACRPENHIDANRLSNRILAMESTKRHRSSAVCTPAEPGCKEESRLFGTDRNPLRLWALSSNESMPGHGHRLVAAHPALTIVSIEPLGEILPMFDITTGTGDFIANGVVSHNCYARPTHEYLGYNAGIDFETKIVVKRDAARLAREEMMRKSWKPTVVSISGVTDPYQPVERKLGITRSILETMREFRNPIAIGTKNAMVLRDLDLLAEMAAYDGAAVFLSITTLDRELARRLEPRTSTPELRLHAVRKLAEAGVPVGVMMAPLIPGLTDQEIPTLLQAAAEAGAHWAYYVMLRLPLAVRPIFIDWLEREEPERRDKVLHTIEDMRGGSLNLAEFGRRMSGTGPRADMIRDLFNMNLRRHCLNRDELRLSTEHFRRPGVGGQMGLFE